MQQGKMSFWSGRELTGRSRERLSGFSNLSWILIDQLSITVTVTHEDIT